MKEQRNCPQCGRPLPSDTPQGLCPACLLKRGLESNTIGETAGEKSVRWSPPSVEELSGSFPELDILELIGRGGMGAVYKARQKELDRLVALKILPPEIGQRASFAQRFAREAQAMAKLGHPNIVTIHDFGQRGGLYFFLMEYVDGLSLRGVLNSGGVSAKEALAIVPQICDALQYAHDRGIVHRDIKPENILLNQQGQVKIADFGLAKLVGLPPVDATAAEKVMGTPQYMAPEQVERPGEVDHRADIYSLGVVFYQMLTGELPIGRFEPPSHRVLIDVRLDEVVLRALEREPARRYQQVSEVRTQVETIVATSPGATRLPPAVAEPAATSPRFSRLAILGLLWALLLPLGSAVNTVAASLCAELEPNSVWRWVIGAPGFGMVVLGLIGLFGTTILGCIAIGQIRRSAGRLYGLRLALFDALLFPLLALDGLIGWLCMSIADLMSHSEQISREGLAAIAHTTAILDIGRDVAILICILVDGLVIWLSWRAAKKPITPSPAPTVAREAVPDTGPNQAERASQAVKAPAIGLVVAAGINLAVLLALVAIVVIQGNIAERKVTDIAGHVVEHTVVEWTLMVPITLAGFIINGMILLGSMRMMQLRNRGLAITAAILALIAAPGNIIGLPFGIWTLVVLNRRDARKPASPLPLTPPAAVRRDVDGAAEQQPKRARQAVKAPAIGMMVAGGISIVVIVVILAMLLVKLGLHDARSSGGRTVTAYVLSIAVLLAGLLINTLLLVGAMRMMQLRNYGFAVTTSILAMVPAPGNIIGLPMGIWALVVLSRREVKDAFNGHSSAAAERAITVYGRVAIIVAILGLLLAAPMVWIVVSRGVFFWSGVYFVLPAFALEITALVLGIPGRKRPAGKAALAISGAMLLLPMLLFDWKQAQPVYRPNVLLEVDVHTGPAARPVAVQTELQAEIQAAKDEAVKLLVSPEVLKQAADGITKTRWYPEHSGQGKDVAEALREVIEVKPIPDTTYIQLSMVGGQEAASILNQVAQTAVEKSMPPEVRKQTAEFQEEVKRVQAAIDELTTQIDRYRQDGMIPKDRWKEVEPLVAREQALKLLLGKLEMEARVREVHGGPGRLTLAAPAVTPTMPVGVAMTSRFKWYTQLIIHKDFGPTAERVLTDMIDLDTGELVNLPQGVTPQERSHWINSNNAWIRQHGVDAIEMNHGLTGLGLMLAEVDPDSTADELDEQLRPPRYAQQADVNFGFSHTGIYGFRTRQGALGVLQLLGVPPGQQGAKIRYKLVKGTTGRRAILER